MLAMATPGLGCLASVMQGVPFPNSVHLQQYTEDVPLQTGEEGASYGGYSLVRSPDTFCTLPNLLISPPCQVATILLVMTLPSAGQFT
jgi:hypothetical protein